MSKCDLILDCYVIPRSTESTCDISLGHNSIYYLIFQMDSDVMEKGSSDLIRSGTDVKIRDEFLSSTGSNWIGLLPFIFNIFFD